jgi:hypothetical protein
MEVPGQGERDYWGNTLYNGAPDRGASELPLKAGRRPKPDFGPNGAVLDPSMPALKLHIHSGLSQNLDVRSNR